jgi:hypothetical protein
MRAAKDQPLNCQVPCSRPTLKLFACLKFLISLTFEHVVTPFVCIDEIVKVSCVSVLVLTLGQPGNLVVQDMGSVEQRLFIICEVQKMNSPKRGEVQVKFNGQPGTTLIARALWSQLPIDPANSQTDMP